MLSPREGWKSNCTADREIWRCARKRIVWFQRENYVTYGDVALRLSQQMCNFFENDHSRPRRWCILNLHLVRLTVIFHVYRVVIRRDYGSNPNSQLKRHWKTVDSTSSKTSAGWERVSPRSERQGGGRTRYYMLVFHEKFASRSKFIIWVFPRTC